MKLVFVCGARMKADVQHVFFCAVFVGSLCGVYLYGFFAWVVLSLCLCARMKAAVIVVSCIGPARSRMRGAVAYSVVYVGPWRLAYIIVRFDFYPSKRDKNKIFVCYASQYY